MRIPEATFSSLEEAEAFMRDWTNKVADDMFNAESGVTVKFSDRKTLHRIATCNVTDRIITYYRCFIRPNLQNSDYFREVIVHECSHLLRGNHGKKFKLLAMSYGVETKSRHMAKLEPSDTPAPFLIECPSCGRKSKKRSYDGSEYQCRFCKTTLLVTRV
jgi:predicted SprT family Zn-dependent metalloprotease